jgi:hypothetical protein
MFHGEKHWFHVWLRGWILQKKGWDYSCKVENELQTAIQDLTFWYGAKLKVLPDIKYPIALCFCTIMKSPRAHTIPKRLVRTTKECIEEFIWINLQNQKKKMPKVKSIKNFKLYQKALEPSFKKTKIQTRSSLLTSSFPFSQSMEIRLM